MATANVTMRMDEELKNQLQELVSNLGMDLTTFFTITAKQAVREQRIPFNISMEIPNTETIAAIEEVRKMKKIPLWENLIQMLIRGWRNCFCEVYCKTNQPVSAGFKMGTKTGI